MSARFVLIVLAALAGLCAFMAFARAQEPPAPERAGCGPLQAYLKHLEDRFDEFRILELIDDGVKFVITRSDAGTWTVLRVEGVDAACIMAEGKSSEVDRGV